jgi:uncharacterized protein YutE (UPF0331/DUF86 family)
LAKLGPLKEKDKAEFMQDEYLRDIVERNLEVAAQACIDIANRIIALEGLEKPTDYYEAIIRLGEEGILSYDSAQKLAPIAGFRNILIHEYLAIDWDEVYGHLQRLEELHEFARHIREWLKGKVDKRKE